MKFSESWLREFADPRLSTRELVEQFTMAGLEVNGFEPVAAQFDKVVVGEILAVNPHPQADKLVVCRVSGGAKECQVVCGAANARAGIKTPFALAGAAFPELKIKKTKLRGVASDGMLCSEKELGLSDNHEGLMELPLDAPVGEDIRVYLKLEDTAINLDLTPNRGDCLSMIGLARETGLNNRLPVMEPESQPVKPTIDDTLPVELAAGEACPRFVGRVIKNIDQGAESPLWMKEKLRRAGLRSIDPVVDVTHYVMLELGQPLHAYDYTKLNGGIIVRQSEAGENVTLLDGKAVETLADTLLITDGSGPIGLAGVMGGLTTSVTAATRDIYLESAFFSPTAIAGRARSYGMTTDAAHRFERGVDWRGQERAIERATGLLLEITGGEPGPVVDTVDKGGLPDLGKVKLRAARIKLLLGVEIDHDTVDDILMRLGFHAHKEPSAGKNKEPSAGTDKEPSAGTDKEPSAGSRREQTWEVSVPSYRFDIAIEADLIEEMSRVYGYNNLPVSVPYGSLSMAPRPETTLSLNRVRDQLVTRGYFEAITYSFVDAGLQNSLDPAQEPITLANPLSPEMAVMRTTLWSGLLKSLMYNLNRQQHRVRLFETGLCFSHPPNRASLDFDAISQVKKLAVVACGSRQDENWSNDQEPIDFYDIKGDLESLLALTGEPASFEFTATSHPALHSGQSADIRKDGKLVGHLGLLNPEIRKQLDIRSQVFLFEIEIDAIIVRKVAASSPLSRFPGVRRDIAVMVGRAVTSGALRACILAAADDTLYNLKLFDVYQGKGIDLNRKSLALGLTFQHASRTLTDDEVNNSLDKVVAALEATLGASLRN